MTLDGREATTALVVPGQLFGLGALLGRETNATQAETVERAIACGIAPWHLVGLMAKYPELMARVIMGMAGQLLTLEHRVEELAIHTLPARPAHLLLDVAASDDGRGLRICDWSQDELATALASTRESVAGTLGAWRRNGIVELGRRHIVIKQAEALRRISGQP